MFFKNPIILSFFAITLCNASLNKRFLRHADVAPDGDFPATPGPAPLPTDYPLLPLNHTRYECTNFSSAGTFFFTYDKSLKGMCYLYPKDGETNTWHEAQDKCRKLGADLLSIHSAADNYLLSHRPVFSQDYYKGVFWTGLNLLAKRGNRFSWSDNSYITYYHPFANYASNGDPLNLDRRFQGRCVSFRTLGENEPQTTYPDPGYWFKDDCNARHPFICQKPAVPTSQPTTPPPPQGHCPPGWTEFAKEKCIQYVPGQFTYNQSIDQCTIIGGEVLSIHSEEEQEFVTIMITDRETPFIGYYYDYPKTYQWEWQDQTKVDYTNFARIGGEGYCITMGTNVSQPGKWMQSNCSALNPVLCNTDMDIKYKEPTTPLLSKCQLDGYEGFVQYRNSCYSLVDNSKATFKDSESACRERNGAHLVSVIDPFEQIFLNYYTKQFGSSDQYWIGYHSDAQTDSNLTQVFEWTDDWPSYFANWDTDEPRFPPTPQEDCVGLMQANGTWRTIPCDTKMGYICKLTNNSKPDITTEKSGVCPHINTGPNDDKTLLWVDVDKRQSHCYWFSIDRSLENFQQTGVQSYSDSVFHCSRRNGTLASVHSMHEIMLLDNHFQKLKDSKDYVYQYTNYWLGLSRAPNGDFFWDDKSPLDFTYWADGQNMSTPIDDLNDDSAQVCVESQITDGKWKQSPCDSYKHNYFVCQVAKENRNDPNASLSHAGRTAGIVIGVLVGVAALVALAVFVAKRMNLQAPHIPSFDNPLSKGSSRVAFNAGATERHNELTKNDMSFVGNL